MEQVRWNVKVSTDTDRYLRMFLASQGGNKKGDLSRFIEQAVQKQLFELSADKIKSDNSELSEQEITVIINEAITWARNNN
ncbi:MAG: ribbon-helix-helix domain-containing protein [Candidatus Symbiodolus clandestinus]